MLKTLVDAAADHGARQVGPDLVELEKLGLFVRVKPIQSMALGTNSLFVGLVDASTSPDRGGISVTCVGHAADMEKAQNEALGHWCLGVLPVLARWRGGDDWGVVNVDEFETRGRKGPRQFTLLKGPVIERGEHDGPAATSEISDAYMSLLAYLLRSAKLRGNDHWLECFAIRMKDGSIDATCRLDNRDWNPGQKRLADDARSWPGATKSYHSRRQFLMLVGDGTPEPVSWLGRIFGRG